MKITELTHQLKRDGFTHEDIEKMSWKHLEPGYADWIFKQDLGEILTENGEYEPALRSLCLFDEFKTLKELKQQVKPFIDQHYKNDVYAELQYLIERDDSEDQDDIEAEDNDQRAADIRSYQNVSHA